MSAKKKERDHKAARRAKVRGAWSISTVPYAHGGLLKRYERSGYVMTETWPGSQEYDLVVYRRPGPARLLARGVDWAFANDRARRDEQSQAKNRRNS